MREQRSAEPERKPAHKIEDPKRQEEEDGIDDVCRVGEGFAKRRIHVVEGKDQPDDDETPHERTCCPVESRLAQASACIHEALPAPRLIYLDGCASGEGAADPYPWRQRSPRHEKTEAAQDCVEAPPSVDERLAERGEPGVYALKALLSERDCDHGVAPVSGCPPLNHPRGTQLAVRSGRTCTVRLRTESSHC